MSTATDLRLVVGAMSPPGGGGIMSCPDTGALPRIKSDLDINESTLFAVYCFIKNFIGAAGNSAVAIDNKIEQAMDLVKSHLMFAVREEVEVLKEKIAELMDRINQLETENSILKANASQEVLAQLSSPNQTQAVSGSAVIAILPVQVQMPQQGQGLQALPMSQQQGQQGQGQQGQGQQGQGQQAQVPSAQQNISPANGSNGNANNS